VAAALARARLERRALAELQRDVAAPRGDLDARETLAARCERDVARARRRLERLRLRLEERHVARAGLRRHALRAGPAHVAVARAGGADELLPARRRDAAVAAPRLAVDRAVGVRELHVAGAGADRERAARAIHGDVTRSRRDRHVSRDAPEERVAHAG